MNGAAALLHALEDLGVTQVFGLPGVQNIEVYDALLASDIHHVLARHEQAAVHMADGYARATGRVGVVLATSGPGATNTVTGIATAYMDSVPVVVITGQVATASIGTDAFQEADITTITLPITKHSYLIKEPGELVPSVFEAFYLATSGRPGPVLIDLPGDVARAPVRYRRPASPPQLPSYKPTIKGNARQIKAAAELIAGSARPVLLAGGGAVSSGASSELITLAEQNTLPVVTTLLAKGVFPASHPLFRGQPGVYGAPGANAALQEADVLLAVGTRFSERVTAEAEGFAPNARIIHIDIDPAEIGKNIRVDVPIVGDAATVLAALRERLEAAGGRAALSGATGEYAAGDEAVLSEAAVNGIAQGEAAENGAVGDGVLDVPPHNPSSGADAFGENATKHCFAALGALLREHDDVIITTDVGQHQLWASHLLDVDEPRRFITSGGLGTMGFGLPAALGAQVACPEALVLCVSGDGSFQMNLQEMATAAVQGLPVKVLLLNNHSHGLVRQWQELFLEQRYSHTLLSDTPDYVALARAYGWEGRTLDLADWDSGDGASRRLTEDLCWLLETEGPALLDVVVPTSDLLEPMVRPGGSLSEVI
jgi:acetolactate synthase-1/2/3 large subunit